MKGRLKIPRISRMFILLKKAHPYAQLMRLEHPVGIWLLVFPCWWSLALSSKICDQGLAKFVVWFGLGALFMRGAGCTYNDIIDRKFDSKTARTALRPIPSGTVSVYHAVLFLIIQLLIGFCILLQMNSLTVLLGISTLMLVFSYPFMKRITFWPQVWLGLTFNSGALLGWSAVTGNISGPALALYAASFFWTLGYDTIYALQDLKEDVIIGVKSSALILGQWVRLAVAAFYSCVIILTAIVGILSNCGIIFIVSLGIAGFHLVWQVITLDTEDDTNCLERFYSNYQYGILILGGIIIDALL